MVLPSHADARTVSPFLSATAANTRHPRLSSRADASAGSDDTSYIPLIIKLADANAALPDGVAELHRRGRFVLAYVPQRLIGEVADLGVVSRIEGGQVCVPVLDRARMFTGLPEVVEGSGLPAVYTGKGVVAGFTDIGFDPNHIAFRDPVTGESRVKLLTDYGKTPQDCVRLDTPEEISGWETDDDSQWHATHVAGIMGGGYRGNPYWGIATGADIVATTSDLYDALLLAGMEDVVGYAREVGKPAVINMSISASLGPHDGTSLFCQYLDELAKEATICISAGNDGGKAGAWRGVFPEDCATAAMVLDVPSWGLEYAKGYVDVWSGDASTFDFSLVVVDYATGEVMMREEFPTIAPDAPETMFAIGSSADLLAEAGMDGSNGRASEAFARYLDGIMAITTEVNPENGRFNALVYVDVKNHPLEEGASGARYVAAIEVKGKRGQRLSGYASDLLKLGDVPGYPSFAYRGADGAINDFVTARGVIGVGAMCSRDSWPLIGGGQGHGNLEVGDVAAFSSCISSSPKGVLPDVVAPGAWLISSVSTPYVEAHPDLVPALCEVSAVDGVDYYWDYASGTSMSSPYVAGVCALWLEANQAATPADIRAAIGATLVKPTVDPSNLRWGKGILDSYAGLKTILAGSGVDDVAANGDSSPTAGLPPLPSPLTPESLALYAAENACEVYTTDGRRVYGSSLASGVYILHGQGGTLKVIL